MLSQTLQAFGLVLDFIGALILIIPLLKSEKDIEEETSTSAAFARRRRSIAVRRESMIGDRLLGIVGLFLLSQIQFFVELHVTTIPAMKRFNSTCR